MKQVIRKGLKEIIVDEVPEPIVTANHVLVRPYFSLISSGTETADIHRDGIIKEVAENPSHLKTLLEVMKKTNPVSTIRELRAKFSDYAVLGYAGAGVVTEKHAEITDLAIGQRVAYGGEGTGHGEVVCISRNLAARIPDEVQFEHAAFATLGAIAMNAVRQADIQVGETVVVVGLGLVGQLVSQIVRCQGGVVIALDLQKARMELAKELGADYVLSGDESAVSEIRALTEGRGADAVIVAAASRSPAPVQSGVKMCRERGRLVIVGIVPLQLPFDEMYKKELKLLMARAYGPGSYDPRYEKEGHDYPISFVRWTEKRNMEEFLRLVGAGRINVLPMISHEFCLDDAPIAYETIMNSSTASLAVLLRYPITESIVPLEQITPVRTVKIANAPEAREKQALKFALVGAGNLARWEHLPALTKNRQALLRAVYSARGAKGKAYGLRFKAQYATTDFRAILDDPDVDVVLIASRHREHAVQTIESLRAGKHVFVEKPMAISIDECRSVLQAVFETGCQLAVGFNRRFAPFYVEMKGYLASRTAPAVVNIRMSAPYMSGDFWGASATEGGAIIGEAVHMIDLLRFLLDSDPISISAFSLPTGVADPIGENNVTSSLKFGDGSIANLAYCTVGSDNAAGELVEAFAPGIAVRSEDFKKFIVKRSGKTIKKSKLWAAKGYEAQMRSFVQNIIQEKVHPVTAIDGAKAFLGCSLILESAAQGGVSMPFDTKALQV